MENNCRDYQNVFHVSADKLSCINAVKHPIGVVQGTRLINTKPYRSPETQEAEDDESRTRNGNFICVRRLVR
jgi:hypothetical protein